MTMEVFLNVIQGAYAPYNATQLKVVKTWLKSKPEKYFGEIMAEVQKSYSWRFKSPPGPSELDEAFQAVLDKLGDTNPLLTYNPDQEPQERLSLEDAQPYFDDFHLMIKRIDDKANVNKAKGYRKKGTVGRGA